jgi:pimeloyl-ACP methyl ester carboxylesterase
MQMIEQRAFSRVISYRRRIPESPARIIALHGALRAARDLFVLAEVLPAVDFTAVDLPGHGNAPESMLGYSPETLADAVREILADEEDPSPVVLLGESFSGLAALVLAGLDRRIKQVILIDTPFDTRRMLASQQVLLQTWLTQPANKQMVEGISRDFFGLDVINRTVTPRTYWRYVRECPVPVTMVAGTLKAASPQGVGAFFDEQDAAALTGIPGFMAVMIEGAGHGAIRGKPHAVAQVVAQHLSDVASNTSG